MSGIQRTVLGAVMVFDVVATLEGAPIATLGGVAVPTLGAVLTRDGALGTRDMIVESCVIAARCLILALAVMYGASKLFENVTKHLKSFVVF
jgi:hypothetical protein